MLLTDKFNEFRQRFKRAPAGPAQLKFDPQKAQAFLHACQLGDKAAANRAAKKKALPPQILGQGLMVFLLNHKDHTGLDDLVKGSQLQKDPSNFVSGLLINSTSPEQQLEVIKFVNEHKIPYQAPDVELVLKANNYQAFGDIMSSGLFDPRSGHSAVLLYAATLGNKELFSAMHEMGANPQEALMQGPVNDPAYATGYKNLGCWLHELYLQELTNIVRQKVKMSSTGPDGALVPGAPPPGPITDLAYDTSTYAPAGPVTSAPAPEPVPVPAPAASTTTAKPIDLNLYAPKA